MVRMMKRSLQGDVRKNCTMVKKDRTDLVRIV